MDLAGRCARLSDCVADGIGHASQSLTGSLKIFSPAHVCKSGGGMGVLSLHVCLRALTLGEEMTGG